MFEWSSYNHYLLSYEDGVSFIDVELIRSYFTTNSICYNRLWIIIANKKQGSRLISEGGVLCYVY